MTTFERIENLRRLKGISQGKSEKELGFSNGSISLPLAQCGAAKYAH